MWENKEKITTDTLPKIGRSQNRRFICWRYLRV